MIMIFKIFDFVVRLALNICLYLLIPITTIIQLLLWPVFGIVLIFGLVCYAWFMWGVVILIFFHDRPQALPKGLHMIEAGGLRMVAALAAIFAILMLHVLYDNFLKWLERGGFLIKKDARFSDGEATRRRYTALAKRDLWARFRVWRTRRFLDLNPVALDVRDTRR